jgi:prolyl-tRNA synthetase
VNRRSVLTPQSADFPRWYQEVVSKAELADNGPVRGTMVIRPYGYAIWERMQAELDRRIKALGVPNAYFPLFIPEEYFRREAEHVEGFSPELAVVTHAGGEPLPEPIAVRPTSETIINSFFAKWLQSYRDLPLAVNQWSNVVRWEMRSRLFLRTTEFLWQEGHTAHASFDDARRFALRVLEEVYEDFMVNVLGIPVVVGYKTERERFAGATTTWAAEAMMRDGRALQMGTSHELGQNFSRVFDITFLDREGAEAHAWQTSWGASTRLVGALIMAHGDDFGLRLPPRLAPIQVVVQVVRPDGGAGERAAVLAAELVDAGVRAELDARTDLTFGRRAVDWELKGVPLRLNIGPREVAAGRVPLVRRDTRTESEIPLDEAAARTVEVLETVQSALFEEARSHRLAHTLATERLDEAEEAARTGFGVVRLSALGEGGEDRLNAAGLSVRCIHGADGHLVLPPGQGSSEEGPSEEGGADGSRVAVVARAY